MPGDDDDPESDARRGELALKMKTAPPPCMYRLAVGPAAVNRKLSIMRSMSPLSVTEVYLVNTPHDFYKVSSVGDMYAPKKASAEVEQRYQNVRIVAAYNEAQLSSS